MLSGEKPGGSAPPFGSIAGDDFKLGKLVFGFLGRFLPAFLFLRALDERPDFFTLKLRYEGERLVDHRFG